MNDEAPAAEPPAAAAPAFDRAKWIVFSIVGVVSLVADQVTKAWARADLPVSPRGCAIPDDLIARTCQGVAKPVIDNFWDWRLSMNPGSAFGFLAGQGAFARWFFTLVGIAAVIGMIVMLRRARRDQKVLHWALGLVIGGALGNLLDRIVYGVVTDFILWRYHTQFEWPVFNVADVALVVGVGLMFIDIQRENKRDKRSKKEKREDQQKKAKAAGLVKDF